MSVQSALTLQGVEGAFYLGFPYNPACSMVSPVPAGTRAGPGGTAIGRFGWMDAEGIVRNARLSANDQRGLVLPDIPLNSDWRNVFYDDVTCTWRIREGLPVTLLGVGKVWVKFIYGAEVGLPVYANILDGSAIAGYSPLGELTPWSVGSPAAAQAMATITTWSR